MLARLNRKAEPSRPLVRCSGSLLDKTGADGLFTASLNDLLLPNSTAIMEVFVNSIAHSATELDVIQAVAAVLHAPPLSQNALRTNFHVNLFRYHTQNRHQVTAAKLTIPDLDLARRFLGSYGTFSMAKIFVHGRPMRFGVSKDNARPELLHKLRTTAFVDPRVERDKRKKLAELSHPIRIAGVEFGRLCGDDVFSPESEHSLPSGEISFDGERRMVVVKSSSSSQARTICMPFSSLDKIFALPTTTPSVLIFLAKPPLFEETGPERLFNPSDRDPFGFDDILASFLEDMSLEAGPPPHRRKAAFAALHAPTSPFTSSHIRILFPPSAELEQFRYRRNKIRLPKVVSSHIKIERRLLFAPSKLAKLNSIMSRLEISVAFQIQLMLSNGILDAEQLCGLGLESEVVALEQKLGAVGAEKVLALFASHLLHSSGEEPERDDYDWLEDDLESATNSRPFITRDPHRPIKPRTPTDLVAELRRAADHVRLTPSRRFNADQSSVCRHVVITPTSLDLEGPFPDQSNSVLRLYGRPECFIRISVRDEDYGKFRHDRETDVAKFLRERFLPFFVDGIQLAGRKFEFLGYSSSALRDHSTWFLTPFSHQGRLVNAVSIRRGLGDVSLSLSRLLLLLIAFVAVLESPVHSRTMDGSSGAGVHGDAAFAHSSTLASPADPRCRSSRSDDGIDVLLHRWGRDNFAVACGEGGFRSRWRSLAVQPTTTSQADVLPGPLPFLQLLHLLTFSRRRFALVVRRECSLSTPSFAEAALAFDPRWRSSTPQIPSPSTSPTRSRAPSSPFSIAPSSTSWRTSVSATRP